MIDVTYPCAARVNERQLKLVGHIAEISIEGPKIYDVKYDVEVGRYRSTLSNSH
jgi:hypothetical protein